MQNGKNENHQNNELPDGSYRIVFSDKKSSS